MIYRLLKTISKLALKVYFREIHIEGKDQLPKEGPFLIVANHPSSFLDPVSIAVNIKPKISFLAKGIMFKNKIIASILRGLNMVPVYRAQDDPKMVNKNTEVFKSCYKKLKEKGVIMIFPEGTSEMERRLRKIKTGAARIALGAEKEYDYSLNLKIVPVGLNYTKSSRFRSEVFVNFGEPIKASDYFEAYKKDEIGTAKNLTEKIENDIRSLMIAVDKEENDELVERIESIYKTSLKNKTPNENEIVNDLKASQAIVEAVSYFQKTKPEVYDTMANKIDRYFLKLRRVKLSDKSLDNSTKKPNGFSNMIKASIALILGFPFWLFGFIASYIPYKLPRIVALKLTDSEAFYGALLMSLGTLFFIIFYSLEIFGFWILTQNPLFTILFGILLVLSGFFTIYYARNARRLYFNFKLYSRKHFINELINERISLINAFDQLRTQYLKENP
ncbi:MAG: lysophospholipid acyltransferase family protein [Vicingaceae bacterium]|nr:lysophospholipid acyltransferase family protein [Vicingaceae bacterium]